MRPVLVLGPFLFLCVLHPGQSCWRWYGSSSKAEIKSCPYDFFLEEDGAGVTRCNPCSTADPLRKQVVLTKCSPMNDTIIGCAPGYFRYLDSYTQTGRCIPCRKCGRRGSKRFEVRPCGNYEDTLCDDYCGRGQYLDRFQRVCKPCPDGYFMAEEKHVNLECRYCAKREYFSRERVVWKCNKTHNSVVMCRSGYFRTWGADGWECRPCHDCGSNKVKISCGDWTNTVCE